MGKRYSDDLVVKVRELRLAEKLSFRELGRRFNVSSNTIGTWCRGPVGNRWDSIIKSNQRKREQLLLMDSKIVPQIKSINGDRALLLAGLLYGCEGSKYPAHVGVSFANSDPSLVVTFLCLLRKAFDLDKNKFSVHLQVHTTHDYLQIRKYWSNLLNIPESQFIKPTITEPKGGKHRTVYFGTCTLRYRDYRIQLRLLGVFGQFLTKFQAI